MSLRTVSFGDGLAPDVRIANGMIHLAYGTQTTGVQYRVFDLSGNLLSAHRLAGFYNSWPRFAGDWLVFKAGPPAFIPVAVNVSDGRVVEFTGRVDGNFGIIANEAGAIVWQTQQPSGYQLTYSFVSGGHQDPPIPGGAPDGLEAVLANGTVIYRKDIRLNDPAVGGYPQRAGDLMVGQYGFGIGVRFDGGPTRWLLGGSESNDPRVATDGSTYAVTGWGNQGVRLSMGTRADFETLPLAPSAVEIPAINRPLHVVWYEHQPPAVNPPGNALLRIYEHPLFATVATFNGRVIAQYVMSLRNSVEEIETQIAALPANLPAYAYWDDNAWPRWPTNLRPQDYVSIRLYWPNGMPLALFEASARATLASVPVGPKIALTGQAYLNPKLSSDLGALVPLYARLVRDFPRIDMLALFSDAGRSNTGLAGHPEIRPLYEQLMATVQPPTDAGVPTVQAPNFTIEAFINNQKVTFPATGVAPLKVRGMYVDTGGGVPDWIEWLTSPNGHDWSVAVRNPGFDIDHTYTFPVGTVYIAARAGNAAGIHPTGAERKIVVTAAQPEPQPEPAPQPQPQPQPTPPKGDKLIVRARHGGAWSVDADGFVIAAPSGKPVQVVDAGGGLVGLRMSSGFIADENDGRLKADRGAIGEWEQWKEVPSLKFPGHVGFLGRRGRFASCCQDGPVLTNATALDGCESFVLDAAGAVGSGSTVAGPFRVEGRQLVNDAGVYRPVWVSWLRSPSRSRDEQARFLDWAVETGFNGARSFFGDLPWAAQSAEQARAELPRMRALIEERGMGLLVSALTETRQRHYDKRGHVRELGQGCAGFNGALFEMANEPYHETQDDETRRADYLRSLGAELPPGLPYALGTSEDDELDDMAGGIFITDHMNRSRDEWNMVRRVNELRKLSERTGKWLFSSEPIKFGSQNANPAIAFAMGLLNRGCEVGSLFHFDEGLQAVVPEPGSRAQELADAFIEGSRLIRETERLSFQNSGNDWPQSPVKSANVPTDENPNWTVSRVYCFLIGNRGYGVALGLRGDPRIEWHNGWRHVETLAAKPGVEVYAIER